MQFSFASLAPVLLGAAAAVIVVALAVIVARRIKDRAEREARSVQDEARERARVEAHEIIVAAEERTLALEEESDRRDRELETREADIETRARELDQGLAELKEGRRSLEQRAHAVARVEDAARAAEREAVEKRDAATRALERIAGLTAAEARAELVAGIEDEARREGARLARKIEDEIREKAEREATQLIVQATQRVTLREVLDTTVSFIELPNDEMKGRIIGREGRNIRALEHATGIDLVVDDTPGAILISSFDPIRREIARVAIDRLVEDGRIHPARIEEVVDRVRQETEALIEEAGSQAAYELGMSDLHPKLLRRVGRMRFRTHHGTNLLRHSIEVALIAGHMAEDLGARVEVVRRAGLFHEIGRVDDSITGHSTLGSAELAGRFGEPEEVVHAIQALHPEVKPKTVEALLLDTANRVSDNRPGARRDNLEVFIERLSRIERLASDHDGVIGAYAVKAGKEIRVLVDSRSADDGRAYALSREIARALERELAFPGQIKVTVVRETRAVTFAV